jgi:hypothetical protein
MNNFKDFGIAIESKTFVGDKIKIKKVLNLEISVYDYLISDSKFKDKSIDGKCLKLQICLGDTKHIVFTGSKYLQECIEKVPKDKYPFKTIIIENNERYEFS